MLTHTNEGVVVEHRGKTEGPEILVKNLLPLVTPCRYVDLLTKSTSIRLSQIDGNSLLLGAHLLHAIGKWRSLTKKFIHEITEPSEWISWPHSCLSPLTRLLLLLLLLGNLLLLLLLWQSLCLLLLHWSPLSISPRRYIVNVHSIQRSSKLVRSHISVSQILPSIGDIGWHIGLLLQLSYHAATFALLFEIC
jgi:hypothetical protein